MSHEKTPAQHQADELTRTIESLTRLREEIDPSYIPRESKSPGVFRSAIEQIIMMIDTLMVYGFYALLAAMAAIFVWCLCS